MLNAIKELNQAENVELKQRLTALETLVKQLVRAQGK
jgi:hypothetical protein